jgi:hypothetical protein
LVKTQNSIEQKLAEAEGNFRSQAAQELHAAQQRAQKLSEDIVDSVQHHLHAGVERFQQRVADAGANLDRRGEDMIQSLQNQLQEHQESHRRQIEQVNAAASSESSRMLAQVAELGSRVGKLDESVRRFESDLTSHLEQVSGEIVSSARNQLERSATEALKQLEIRNSKELTEQLEDACSRMRIIQKGIEASLSDLLKAQVTESVQSFAQTMDEMAEHSVCSRWEGFWASLSGRSRTATLLKPNKNRGAFGAKQGLRRVQDLALNFPGRL